MSKFLNLVTGIQVSVADEKDSRFTDGWVSADAKPEPVKVAPSKRAVKVATK